MQTGQRKKKCFTPTPAQDARRLRLLRVFNRPFMSVRLAHYCGATWAGTIVSDTFYGDLLAETGRSVRQKVGDKVRERRAAGYHGIYSTLVEELEGLAK